MRYARTLLAALGCAAVLAAQAGEAEIRKNLEARLPEHARIEEVRKTPVAGLYEVRINDFEIFYSDEQGNYVLQGNLIDTRAGRDLTGERVNKLTEVDFDKLPLKDAFKLVRGNGKRRLAVFEDPNCGYCKHFEADMRKVDDVTVYLFLYPVLGADSTVKSRDIWCSKDRAKAWNDWMLNAVKPTAASASCDAGALQRNLQFGRRHNVTGTPTLFFTNGTRAPGAISAPQVEEQLSAAK